MEEPTLFDYWLALYRRRYIIITIIISSMIIAYFLSKTLPPVYEAKAVCFVPSSFSPITFYQPNSLKQMGRNIIIPPVNEELFAPFIGILKSKTIAELVHTDFPPKKLGDLLRKDVDFQLNDEYMLEIYVRDKDPQVAANIANTYVKYFNQILSDYSLQFTEEQIHTLEKEIKKTKKSLKKAQENLESFQKRHKIADLDEEMKQLISQKTNFDQKIKETKVSLNEVSKQIESTQIQLTKEAKLYLPSELTITSPLIESLKQRLCDLEGKMAALQVEYRKEHPEFLAVKKEYQETKKNLEKEIDRVIKSKVKAPNSFYERLRQDLVGLYVNKECLKAREVGYQQALREIEQRIKDIPYLRLKLADFTEEVNRLQSSLDSLKLALSEAKAQRERDLNPVITVDKATPPATPSFPIPWLNVLVAGISGIIVGIFYAFLVDYIKRKREEQIIGILDLIKVEKYIQK